MRRQISSFYKKAWSLLGDVRIPPQTARYPPSPPVHRLQWRREETSLTISHPFLSPFSPCSATRTIPAPRAALQPLTPQVPARGAKRINARAALPAAQTSTPLPGRRCDAGAQESGLRGARSTSGIYPCNAISVISTWGSPFCLLRCRARAPA